MWREISAAVRSRGVGVVDRDDWSPRARNSSQRWIHEAGSALLRTMRATTRRRQTLILEATAARCGV